MDQITRSFANTQGNDTRMPRSGDARLKLIAVLCAISTILIGCGLWFWITNQWYALTIGAGLLAMIVLGLAIAWIRTSPVERDDLEVEDPSRAADTDNSGGRKIPPDLVIAEICHRVGNSLQTTTSLIRSAERQMRKDADPAQETHACADILAVIGTRIATISLVQRMLYCEDQALGNAGQVTQASLAEFLLSLVDHLKIIHERPDITIQVEVTSTDIGSEHIQSVGLIVCELVTNALRHGYKVDDHGNVAITIRDDSRCKGFIIEVADDGCGMKGTPQKSDADKGLSIVADLAAGLGSSVTFMALDKGVLCQIAPE